MYCTVNTTKKSCMPLFGGTLYTLCRDYIIITLSTGPFPVFYPRLQAHPSFSMLHAEKREGLVRENHMHDVRTNEHGQIMMYKYITYPLCNFLSPAPAPLTNKVGMVLGAKLSFSIFHTEKQIQWAMLSSYEWIWGRG